MALFRSVSYRAIPGLDQYPEADRYAVYRDAHAFLMRTDVGFRRRWRAFVGAIVLAGVVPGLAACLGGRGVWVSVFLTPPMVITVGGLAWAQQRFANRSIGDVLSRREKGKGGR